jgi:hypothetical protein
VLSCVKQERLRISDLRNEQLPYHSGWITEVKADDDNEVLRAEIRAHTADFKVGRQVMAVTPSRELAALEIVSVVAKQPRDLRSTVTFKLVPEEVLDGEGERVSIRDFVEGVPTQVVVLSEAPKTVPVGITVTLVPDRLDPRSVFEKGTTQKVWDTDFDGVLDNDEGERLVGSINPGFRLRQLPDILKNFKAIDADYVPRLQGFSKTTALFPKIYGAIAFRMIALNRQQCRMHIDFPTDILVFRGLEHNSVTKKFTNVGLIGILKDARKILGQSRWYPDEEDKEEKKIRRRQYTGGVDPIAAQHALYPDVEARRPAYLMNLFGKDGKLFMKRIEINKILAIRSKKGITYRLVSEPDRIGTLVAESPLAKPFKVQVGSMLFEKVIERDDQT